MDIQKAKLPKGMSYPLRSSVLADALGAAGIALDTQLIIGPSEIFFDAHFWPPNPNVGHERLFVRSGAIPATQAREARAFLEDAVLPQLSAWLSDILALPRQSPRRQAQRYFRRDWPKRA